MHYPQLGVKTNLLQFLVINYSTFFISFYSQGIVDLVYPARPQHRAFAQDLQVVGQDAFRFLAGHSDGSLPGGFKNRVRNALKLGHAVSVELTLCVRRYLGFEKFIVHWTPLKGEKGDVAWVVVTLGSTNE
jgi:hypothetical protein